MNELNEMQCVSNVNNNNNNSVVITNANSINDNV